MTTASRTPTSRWGRRRWASSPSARGGSSSAATRRRPEPARGADQPAGPGETEPGSFESTALLERHAPPMGDRTRPQAIAAVDEVVAVREHHRGAGGAGGSPDLGQGVGGEPGGDVPELLAV